MPKETNTVTQDIVSFLNTIGNVHADKVNPAFRSKYASLAEILDTVKSVAKAHNLAVAQTLSSADGLVRVTTTFIHVSGETREAGNLAVKSDGLTPQQLGSAITYLRRMSLSCSCCLATEMDDDGASASRQGPAKASAPVGPWFSFLTALEAERAHEYLTKKGWLPESAQDLSELSPDKVELIVGNKPAFLKAIK
jgi:hypothetical protein